MVTPLAIEKMSIEEKLQTMEALWDDLCQHQEALPVHDWQKEILDQREQMIGRGESRFSDWEDAKKRITKETS
jgi:putative addiction module component (TIGR02574 family)